MWTLRRQGIECTQRLGRASVYSNRYNLTLPRTTRSVAQYFAIIQQATVWHYLISRHRNNIPFPPPPRQTTVPRIERLSEVMTGVDWNESSDMYGWWQTQPWRKAVADWRCGWSPLHCWATHFFFILTWWHSINLKRSLHNHGDVHVTQYAI